jgi:hypothetical protein
MSPRLRLALALVALAAGLVNLALVLGAGDTRPRPLPYLLIAIIGVSWSFVAAGLVAWSRRPDNRTGALMVAVGLAYALPGLRLLRTPLGFTLYLLLATLPAAVLAHLIAVFPDGRATTRLQRVFIVANYATTVPLAFVQLLLVDPGGLRCAECPRDLLGTGDRHPYGGAVLPSRTCGTWSWAGCCSGSWSHAGGGQPRRADAASPRSPRSRSCSWSSTSSGRPSGQRCRARRRGSTSGWT